MGWQVLVVKSYNESGIPFMSTYFVNTGFFTGESYVPTRQSELRVNPTVAFCPSNFNVGDVCELVCIDICTPLSVLLN